MDILTVDVGGTHLKVLATGQAEPRKVDSGRRMTAAAMVEAVKRLTADWTYDVIALGYPGPVLHGVPVREPVNLGPGWVGFDYAAALGRPTRIINDAAMQALGSYAGGRMLFLGLGTGLGSALIVDGLVEPLELGHLPYKRKRTYEEYVGLRGLKRLGKKAWRREVGRVIEDLRSALQPDYVVLGGGNAKFVKRLPPNTRLGSNDNAFQGGFRLWEPRPVHGAPRPAPERRVFDDLPALWEAAAAEFVQHAQAAVGANGRFCVALSGGSTPNGLYRLLATDPRFSGQVPWERTHVFWGDERHVPPDHPDSNFSAAQAGLLSQVPIPPEHVHRVHAELEDAAQAACAYEADLRAVFGGDDDQPVPRFDLVLLGLGADGHTASLFPGTSALHDEQHLVVANWVGKLDAQRITLTARVLNNAASVVFLVAGGDKAAAVKAVLEGPYEPEQLPAQLIGPTHGRLVWLLDRAAAGKLS